MTTTTNLSTMHPSQEISWHRFLGVDFCERSRIYDPDLRSYDQGLHDKLGLILSRPTVILWTYAFMIRAYAADWGLIWSGPTRYARSDIVWTYAVSRADVIWTCMVSLGLIWSGPTRYARSVIVRTYAVDRAGYDLDLQLYSGPTQLWSGPTRQMWF